MSVSIPAPSTPDRADIVTTNVATLAICEGVLYFLTPCCRASVTGTSNGVACRSCYRSVHENLGWAALASSATREDILAAFLAIGLNPVIAERYSARVARELHLWAKFYPARESRGA